MASELIDAAQRLKRVQNGETVEEVYGDDGIGGYTAGECWESDQNQLIESAFAFPDLLAACEMLLNIPEPMTSTEHFDYSSNAQRLARSAIAKAKGN